MLRLVDLQVAVRGLTILRHVSLEVAPGSIVGLVGRNGAGKTTTLRAVMGLIPVARGAMTWDGVDLRQIPPYRRAALGIGYLPEDRRLIPPLTVEENLLLPVWAGRRVEEHQRLSWVYGLLPGVRAFATRRAGQLSGGQQKVVALARALMIGTRLLLLDEPFEGLAPALVDQIATVLRKVADDGVGVLVAESEITSLRALADRTYVIERGEVAGPEGAFAKTAG